MQSISVEEFTTHADQWLEQVEAGHRLTLIRGGHKIAEVSPIPVAEVMTPENNRRDATAELQRILALEKTEAREAFLAFLKKGQNLGGFKITDRDALYDRG